MYYVPMNTRGGCGYISMDRLRHRWFQRNAVDSIVVLYAFYCSAIDKTSAKGGIIIGAK